MEKNPLELLKAEEFAVGLKYDKEKSRTDLLDPDWMTSVADVLTFGANKYSKKGECDCHVNLVEMINNTLGNCVKIATTNGLNTTILNINKNNYLTLLNGSELIQKNTKLLWNVDELENLLILTTRLKNLEVVQNETTDLVMSSWIDSWNKQAVQYVEVLKSSSSIIITQPEQFEIDCVKHVILLWDFLNEKSGLIKHVNTCGSTVEIKTGAHNWRGGIAYSRLIAAALRHLFAIMRNEDTDPESGLPHTAHLSCCIMFLHWMMTNRKDLDDRYKKA